MPDERSPGRIGAPLTVLTSRRDRSRRRWRSATSIAPSAISRRLNVAPMMRKRMRGTPIDFAISMLDQAEYAIADAVIARAEADDLALEQS